MREARKVFGWDGDGADSIGKISVEKIAQVDFKKAEAVGGTYNKRMPTKKAGAKKKWRYFYDQEKYDGRDDAHTGGKDNAKAHLSKKIAACIGEKGCDAKAMGPLVKKFGAKKVAEVLRENQKGGTLAFKKGKFSLCKRKG